MRRVAMLVCFACLFGWNTDVSAQTSPHYQWEPFDGPTMALQTGSSLVWGAGLTYVSYLCMQQEVPSIGCIAGGLLANTAYLGSGLLVSVVGEGMGAETTELDFLASTVGYLLGLGAGALAGYGLLADNDADELSPEAFAGMMMSGVVLGTAGAVIGYNLSADPVEAPLSSGIEASASSALGTFGLSVSIRF